MIDNKITIKDDEKVNIQRGAIGHPPGPALPTNTQQKPARLKKLKKSSVRLSAKPDVSRAML